LTLAAALLAELFLPRPLAQLGEIPGLDGVLGIPAAELSAAITAQEAQTARLLAMEGVVGTAVGLDASGRVAVKVYLEHPGAALLPAAFDGIPVVPEVTGRIYALGDAPWDVLSRDAEARANPRDRFPRPVPIGVSTGQRGVTAGTIGARATDGSRIFALSNNHVFANRNLAEIGDNVLQPGVADGGSDPDHAIGQLHDFEPIEFCSGVTCPTNTIDAAIAVTSSENLGTATPEGGYGSPRSNTVEARLNQQVQKYGRTTGHTIGRVTGINATVNVNYRTGVARFVDQIMISGSRTFSAGGDSGSLIVTKGLLTGDRNPVGLLFAGSATNTIANPIDAVLDRFKITIEGN
jgi:hypothetical protein